VYADDSGGAFPSPKNNSPPDAFVAYTKIMKGYLGSVTEPAKLFACPADTFQYDYDEHAFISQSPHLQSRYSYSSHAYRLSSD
jgi:hypothetical protein